MLNRPGYMLETQEHQVQGHSARNINRTDSGTQQFDFSHYNQLYKDGERK